MTDHQILFVALGLIYAWDCVAWVAQGSVAFRRTCGKRSRVVFPSTTFGNSRGGFVWGWPLPPLGEMSIVTGSPFCFGPTGLVPTAAVWARGMDSVRGPAVQWGELGSVEARGRRLLAGGRLLAICNSAEAATEWKRRLARLARLGEKERTEAIVETLEAATDIDQIQRRVEECRDAARPLVFLCNAYFVVLLALTPAVGLTFGFSQTWWFLGLLIASLAVATAWGFHRAHSRVHPEEDDARFTQTLVILLSPPSAVRACDALWRGLLERFHPLAVARVMAPAADFRLLARQTWKQVRFVARHAGSGESTRSLLEWHRKHAERALTRLLNAAGVSVEEFERPPQPMDPSCQSWCPACEAQFTRSGGECPDCGSVSLLPLEGSTPNN